MKGKKNSIDVFHPNRIDKEKNKVELSLKLSDIDPENNPVKPRLQRKRKRKEESKAKCSNSYNSSLNSWLVKWDVFFGLQVQYSRALLTALHSTEKSITKHTIYTHKNFLWPAIFISYSRQMAYDKTDTSDLSSSQQSQTSKACSFL